MGLSRNKIDRLRGAGIILLEVLLSVLIIGASIVYVTQSFSTSIKSMKTAKDIMRLGILLDSKIAELELKDGIEPGYDSGTFEFDKEVIWNVEAEPVDYYEDISRVRVYVGKYSEHTRRSLELVTFMKTKKKL